MKKLLLLSIMMLALSGFVNAQVIADFETIHMNLMVGGADDLSSISVVANPYSTGINTSNWVAKLFRDKDGVSWCGFWAPLTDSVDVTVNKYVHVKVWKPRISPLKFKLEGGPAGTLEIESMYPQTIVNDWEDIVFDFTSKTGKYKIVVLCPDYMDPVGLTEDILIYYDDIVVNNDPTPASAPAYVIENFEEIIKLNLMLGGATDLSNMIVVGNPHPGGINTSNYVVKFLRDMDGVPWGGFWSPLPAVIDVTTNKYIHVKAYKPRISPLKFKIEGGAAGNLEIASMNAQTKVDAWEDFVFDYSSKTGTYPIIAFMPDFQDPVGLTEDISIYFDDIILNNDPNPIQPMAAVTMNVDMHKSGLVLGEKVYIAGDFGGVYGTWNEPGTNPANELVDLDGDSVYSLDMDILQASYQFKFFKGSGWGGGEWGGDPNRRTTISGDKSLTFKWGVKPANVTFNVNMKGSGLAGEDVYVAGNFGGIYGVWNEPGTNANNMLAAQDPPADSIYSIAMLLDSIGTYQLKFFKGAGWGGGEWAGDPNRVYKIRQDTTFNLKWGMKYPEGIGEPVLDGKVRIYPNPVRNMLNIATLEDINRVVITNMVGQEVMAIDNFGIGRKSVNLSDLANGMYFVTFYGTSGGQMTQKIMKY